MTETLKSDSETVVDYAARLQNSRIAKRKRRQARLVAETENEKTEQPIYERNTE